MYSEERMECIIKELKYHVTASALYFLPPGIEMKLFQCFSFSPLLI